MKKAKALSFSPSLTHHPLPPAVTQLTAETLRRQHSGLNTEHTDRQHSPPLREANAHAHRLCLGWTERVGGEEEKKKTERKKRDKERKEELLEFKTRGIEKQADNEHRKWQEREKLKER